MNKFYAYKNCIINKKNEIENNILFFKNINENDNKEKNKNENEEISYEMKIILNKIENEKNLLREITNKLNDEININSNDNKKCIESKVFQIIQN